METPTSPSLLSQVGELSGIQAHKQVWHLSLLQLFRYCGMYPLLVS